MMEHDSLAQWPNVFRTRLHLLQQRHTYLTSLARAQYDPERENYVSLKALVGSTEREFCERLAKTSVAQFHDFLKTLWCRSALWCKEVLEQASHTSMISSRHCDVGLWCKVLLKQASHTSMISSRHCDVGLWCKELLKQAWHSSMISSRHCDVGLWCKVLLKQALHTSMISSRHCDVGLLCGVRCSADVQLVWDQSSSLTHWGISHESRLEASNNKNVLFIFVAVKTSGVH